MLKIAGAAAIGRVANSFESQVPRRREECGGAIGSATAAKRSIPSQDRQTITPVRKSGSVT